MRTRGGGFKDPAEGFIPYPVEIICITEGRGPSLSAMAAQPPSAQEVPFSVLICVNLGALTFSVCRLFSHANVKSWTY